MVKKNDIEYWVSTTLIFAPLFLLILAYAEEKLETLLIILVMLLLYVVGIPRLAKWTAERYGE